MCVNQKKSKQFWISYKYIADILGNQTLVGMYIENKGTIALEHHRNVPTG